ncbi:hypothetical protein EYF80_008532 [Liparis tanakae]|uniref:Uncharacterized protein n=1 Tax=Liparis tanakae TaxID=230148 RepID=A0A4Z2IUE6_9TELE|nr:hypothetical protein EYF80_008532 [Liparis tanakae]
MVWRKRGNSVMNLATVGSRGSGMGSRDVASSSSTTCTISSMTAEGEQRFQWLRGALHPVVEHRLIGGPQHQGVLEQHGQRVDVDVERQHDAPGEEGVGLAMVSGKQRQPDFHAGLATGQPQGLQQVALLLVGATGGPHILHTLGQHHRGAKRELEEEEKGECDGHHEGRVRDVARHRHLLQQLHAGCRRQMEQSARNRMTRSLKTLSSRVSDCSFVTDAKALSSKQKKKQPLLLMLQDDLKLQ